MASRSSSMSAAEMQAAYGPSVGDPMVATTGKYGDGWVNLTIQEVIGVDRKTGHWMVRFHPKHAGWECALVVPDGKHYRGWRFVSGRRVAEIDVRSIRSNPRLLGFGPFNIVDRDTGRVLDRGVTKAQFDAIVDAARSKGVPLSHRLRLVPSRSAKVHKMSERRKVNPSFSFDVGNVTVYVGHVGTGRYRWVARRNGTQVGSGSSTSEEQAVREGSAFARDFVRGKSRINPRTPDFVPASWSLPKGVEARRTVDGDWMITRNGFQWGPPGSKPDRSGAYSDTWPTKADAVDAYSRSASRRSNPTYPDIEALSWPATTTQIPGTSKKAFKEYAKAMEGRIDVMCHTMMGSKPGTLQDLPKGNYVLYGGTRDPNQWPAKWYASIRVTDAGVDIK